METWEILARKVRCEVKECGACEQRHADNEECKTFESEYARGREDGIEACIEALEEINQLSNTIISGFGASNYLIERFGVK